MNRVVLYRSIRALNSDATDELVDMAARAKADGAVPIVRFKEGLDPVSDKWLVEELSRLGVGIQPW